LEQQLAGYREVTDARRARIDNDAWEVIATLEGLDLSEAQTYPRRDFISVTRFLERLDYGSVRDAAEIAFLKMRSRHTRFRYFCGICWTKIRERENAR
jgi:hypothetical protein